MKSRNQKCDTQKTMTLILIVVSMVLLQDYFIYFYKDVLSNIEKEKVFNNYTMLYAFILAFSADFIKKTHISSVLNIILISIFGLLLILNVIDDVITIKSYITDYKVLINSTDKLEVLKDINYIKLSDTLFINILIFLFINIAVASKIIKEMYNKEDKYYYTAIVFIFINIILIVDVMTILFYKNMIETINISLLSSGEGLFFLFSYIPNYALPTYGLNLFLFIVSIFIHKKTKILLKNKEKN